VCFYDAERVLDAIAKFLLHLRGEGKGRVKWKRGEVAEESGEGKGRAWRCRIWECTKIAQKRDIFGIWGHSLGLPPRVIHL